MSAVGPSGSRLRFLIDVCRPGRHHRLAKEDGVLRYGFTRLQSCFDDRASVPIPMTRSRSRWVVFPIIHSAGQLRFSVVACRPGRCRRLAKGNDVL